METGIENIEKFLDENNIQSYGNCGRFVTVLSHAHQESEEDYFEFHEYGGPGRILVSWTELARALDFLRRG